MSAIDIKNKIEDEDNGVIKFIIDSLVKKGIDKNEIEYINFNIGFWKKFSISTTLLDECLTEIKIKNCYPIYAYNYSICTFYVVKIGLFIKYRSTSFEEAIKHAYK